MPASVEAGTVMAPVNVHHQIDILLNKEKDLAPRVTLLITLASECSTSTAVQSFLEALLRWICWKEELYSGAEALLWKTSIIQAVGTTTGKFKELAHYYLRLGSQICTWSTDILSANMQGRISELDCPSGGLPEMVTVTFKLLSYIFDGMVELMSPPEPVFLEDPAATLAENFVSGSFGFVKTVYLYSLNKPVVPVSEKETLRKRTQELLSVICRTVYAFRRHLTSQSVSYAGTQQNGTREEDYAQNGTSLRIVASSVKYLVELGDLSARDGAVSLGLMNISWKSVAALLLMESGREQVASTVDVSFVVSTLLNHGIHALKVPVESWFLASGSEGKDARRICIPVKFFLQMAEKVSSSCPQIVMKASHSIILSVSRVFASLLLRYSSLQEGDLQVLAELSFPSAVNLVHNLLIAQTVEDGKAELLHLITCDNDDMWSSLSVTDLDGGQECNEVMDELFNNKPNGLGLLKTGRVILLISLLHLSTQYDSDVLLQLSLILQWLVDSLLDEAVYVQSTQARSLPSWTPDGTITWKSQLMLSWIISSVQTFALAAVRYTNVWAELQYFVFENIVHPCPVSREVVVCLWIFVLRLSEPGSAKIHVETLVSLLHDMALSNVDVEVQRMVARALCKVMKELPEASMQEYVYDRLFRHEPFSKETTAHLITLLLEEGYSFTNLGGNEDGNRTKTGQFLSSCISCGKVLVEYLKQGSGVATLVSQKQALASLQVIFCQSALVEEKLEDSYLREIQQLAEELILCCISDTKSKNDQILGYTLQLIPYLQTLLRPSFLQNMLPRLHDYVTACHTLDLNLKQTLPELLANLSDIAMVEEEDDPVMKALWGLYHIVLRQRHWALVHMGLASFCHFAAHTSCQELWRFLPEDAALSSTTDPDASANDIFMDCLKTFMERENAQGSTDLSPEEWELLKNEIFLLRRNICNSTLVPTDEVSNVKTVINKTLDAIQTNLETLKTGLPIWRAQNPLESQLIQRKLLTLKDDLTSLLIASRLV